MTQESEKRIPGIPDGAETETPADRNAPDRNIQLTLVRPAPKNEMKLDLAEVADGLRRFLALWIALALGCGAVIAGAGIFMRRTAYPGDAMALIETVMAPLPVEKTVTDEKGNESVVIEYVAPAVDVTRLQDAVIVEQAMLNLGLNIRNLDKVRHGLSISSVLTEEQYEQQTLYHSLLGKNNVNIETVQSILDNANQATRHVVSLDYQDVGYSRRTALQLLNEILQCYRSDFERTANASAPLGSAVASADLSGYDPMEVTELFTGQLDQITAYLKGAIYFRETGTQLDETVVNFDTWLAEASQGTMRTFRSRKTGYTLEDLLRRTELLRKTELVRLTAYINMNGISDAPEVQEERFSWLRDEQERTRAELEVRADSLSAAAAAYDKTPRVYIGNEPGNINMDLSADGLPTTSRALFNERGELKQSALDTYDKLIAQEIGVRDLAAAASTKAAYYGSLAEKLTAGKETASGSREKMETLLTAFSAKLKELTDDLAVTMDEYSREAVKANAMTILVPATAEKLGITSSGWTKILIYAEIVLLVGYLAAALIYGLKESNPRKKRLPAEA